MALYVNVHKGPTLPMARYEATRRLALDDTLYTHLRRLAARVNGEFQGTLNPTALVHEAWEKLERGNAEWSDRTHFVALSARAMRQILVDHARARHSQKRGGERRRTTLSGLSDTSPSLDLIDLDRAIDDLAKLDAVAADVVVLRSFGGLTIGEVAQELACSARTVSNKWTFGRAFLLAELGPEEPIG